ncbi:hypothetical protein DM01DRAFT_1335365, partial [Hesseltinella vesiculosa]
MNLAKPMVSISCKYCGEVFAGWALYGRHVLAEHNPLSPKVKSIPQKRPSDTPHPPSVPKSRRPESLSPVDANRDDGSTSSSSEKKKPNRLHERLDFEDDSTVLEMLTVPQYIVPDKTLMPPERINYVHPPPLVIPDTGLLAMERFVWGECASLVSSKDFVVPDNYTDLQQDTAHFIDCVFRQIAKRYPSHEISHALRTQMDRSAIDSVIEYLFQRTARDVHRLIDNFPWHHNLPLYDSRWTKVNAILDRDAYLSIKFQSSYKQTRIGQYSSRLSIYPASSVTRLLKRKTRS